MAATLVGGAFLSATVQTLVEKLASTEFRDYIANTKLNVSLLRQLQTTLLVLQAVLDDAEEKQIVNPAVKQWLDQLKDAIFDAEDLLNEIGYDSLRCKVESTRAGNKTNKVWNFLSSPFNTFYSEINSQMKIMCERLQLFAQQKDILGLQTVRGRVSHRRPSSSLVNESVMVGRKDDKESLLEMLLSDSGTSSDNNIGVVAILGMGGVGKTTLAQFVYNDKKVQQHFDLKAWACVSEDFDILRVTKTLLESVTSRVWESNNLDFLRVELKGHLKDKRFLFVLDDLWNDDYNDWDELVTPLINGNTGSRVIITTRQQKVAEVAHTFPVHKLEPLSNEDCWSLLSKHALGSENFRGEKNPKLEEIGRKIAKKCGGLPIAAKTLGGLLRSKIDAKEWTGILNSNIWNLPNDNVLPALLLSYQYLPSHLKRCFAYCSIFPKDYPLKRKKMVLLWMAEGFLENSQGEKATEEVGDDYFVELLSRSLIQQSTDGTDSENFVMHDLVNDLATVVSGKTCCRLEYGGNISENVRHLSYNQEVYNSFKKFEILYNFKGLRSFLPKGSWAYNYLSKKLVGDLLPTLRRLRVLTLSHYQNITMLPESIGNLVQLRYLDLSHTAIQRLPDTICNLYYLQTLILHMCWKLTVLPVHIGNLINLRHLDISETNIKEMPMQIVGLENLQSLTDFLVGTREVGLSVSVLGKFPNLLGKLCIKNLHNVDDATEAYDANLKNKEHIEELVLQWGKQNEDSQSVKVLLDILQPSVNLKKLSIVSYGGTSFSSWLGDSSFSNMVSVSMSNCEFCITLPPLGQLPSLKKLNVYGMRILETIGPEFYGMAEGGSYSSFQPFPSLQELFFGNMPNWKEWLPFEGGEFPFPCLKTLFLSGCCELRGHLPAHLSSIEDIDIQGCDRLLATTPTLHWLSLVKSINIEGYSGSIKRLSLVKSISIEGHLDSQGSIERIQLPLPESDMLFSLPKMFPNSACLQYLKLSGIPSLTAFPANGLPTSLQSLSIDRCKNLSFLPPELWSNYTSLVSLSLKSSCDALTSFQLDGFPALQTLYINNCMSLESLVISESSSFSPSNLQSLTTSSCKKLRSLPQRMETLTSLKRLAFFDCDVLRSLPQRTDALNALEELTLYNLPALKLSFCEGACLPLNLRRININSIGRTMTPVTEWGLQRLTALSNLSIEGDDIVKTLMKDQLLPISLVHLSFSNLSEMKSIEGNGLRHLSSLEELDFYNCSVLESFPEDMLPSSLESLRFVSCPRLESLPKDKLPSALKSLVLRNCERLKSLPEDSLPSSLTTLSITKCPLLEARYENQRGEDWSKIAHIPVIKINDQLTI